VGLGPILTYRCRAIMHDLERESKTILILYLTTVACMGEDRH
jgi:hypothetical protein